MPTLATAADMVLDAFKAAFATSPNTIKNWQLTVGDEAVQDIDAFTDQCCQGLGIVLIPTGTMEPGTSQKHGGSLYLTMTVHLIVLRCAPVMGDDLRSPTAAEHVTYTNRVLDDFERMMRAVWTISQFDWITEEDISDPEWDAIPVAGGCGGGTVMFRMAVIGECPE